jgi:hypothetical protein
MLGSLKIKNYNTECLASEQRVASNSGFCWGASVNSIATSQKTFLLRLLSWILPIFGLSD